ncbi:MAG: 3-oxoacyl-ACP synthase III family protein [Phycisphaerales bacterium]
MTRTQIPARPGAIGVRLAGSGSAAPKRVVTNDELSRFVDTSHEWILQRTGIERRHFCTPGEEDAFTLARDAVQGALDTAGIAASELDLVINASVTQEMVCPSNACRVAAAIGAVPAAAFDLCAACSGLVYGMNIADTMIRGGQARTVAVVGVDALSNVIDFDDRTVAILFGDGAGSVVLTADESDPTRGCIFQSMGSDGREWHSLYMPRRPEDVPADHDDHPARLGCLRMNGREVFKFAVTKFRAVIEEALEATGLGVDDVAQFVCHQSNIRIIEAAIEKVGLPRDKVHVNIDEYGNTSAGSVGLVFDELNRAGKVKEGDHVVFVAFGAGLTWASSVWRI